VMMLCGFTFLMPAHPGSPGQNPEGRKMVVVLVVVVVIVVEVVVVVAALWLGVKMGMTFLLLLLLLLLLPFYDPLDFVWDYPGESAPER